MHAYDVCENGMRVRRPAYRAHAHAHVAPLFVIRTRIPFSRTRVNALFNGQAGLALTWPRTWYPLFAWERGSSTRYQREACRELSPL